MTESYSMTTAALEHVQAVAFDLDGTLCDSVPDLAAAAQAMCAHLGLPVLPTQMVESYVGDGISKLVHRVITNDREKEADPEIWEKGFVFFMKYYREHLSDFTRPYPETEAGLGLMVGDSKNDILAAKAAGCFSIGVTFGYGDMTLLSQDKATKPDLLIRTLPEIYENLQPQKNKDEE